jgi:hypothetical protein
MEERLEAVVGARINKFKKKMREVANIMRRTPTKADAVVGANTKEFNKKMAGVKAKAEALDGKDVIVDVKARSRGFFSFFRTAKQHVSELDGAFQDAQGRWRDEAGKFIKIDKKGFVIPVHADLAPFNRAMKTLNKNFKTAQKRLDRISQTIHTIGNVGGNMALGGLLAISPAMIPLLAGAIASLAMLGPMIGVLSGGMFALASAFALAGAGAVAFGALAIPTISKVFEEGAKLNAQQKKAKKAFEGMKDTYKGIVKELEKPVLEVFTKSMNILSDLLVTLKPTFKGAADAMNNLMDSLKASLGTPPVKAFFDYMNKTAGPMLETTGKAIGNVFKGIGSMMVAFGPLTNDIANGFLNMTNRFAEWADGLSKSEKFQSFVDYVRENMPKVRSIFRDAIAGITYFFAAFGPLSSDMMSGLADLMARFKEWSSTLSMNKSFQNFIAYIRENGPAMLTFISEMARLISNLAIALAPLGSKMIEIVNGFLNWFNTLMENNPIVGKIIGFLIVMSGAFQALYPIITVAITMFSGFGSTLAKIFPKLIPIFTQFKAKIFQGLLMIGRQALVQGARMAAGLLLGIGPVGWIIAAVIGLVALIVAKWDEISSFTKKTWNAVATIMKAVWNNIKRAIAEKVVEVYSKVKEYFNKAKDFVDGIDLYESGKKIIKSAVDGILSMKKKVSDAVSTIAGKIRGFFPFSPAKEGPLSTLHRLDFAGPVTDSIARGKGAIQGAMRGMLTVPDFGMNPQLSAATSQSMNVSTSAKYEAPDNSGLGAEIRSALEGMTIETSVEVDGDRIVKATGKPMMKFIDQETKKAGRGR